MAKNMQNLLSENQDLLEYYHELARNYADSEQQIVIQLPTH